MLIQIPRGMNYQQYVQTPEGRALERQSAAWNGMSPAPAAPRPQVTPMPGQGGPFVIDPEIIKGKVPYGMSPAPAAPRPDVPPLPGQGGISMLPGMAPPRPAAPPPQTTLDYNKQRRQQELDFRAAKQSAQLGRATPIATFGGGTPYSPPRPPTSRAPAVTFPRRK